MYCIVYFDMIPRLVCRLHRDAFESKCTLQHFQQRLELFAATQQRVTSTISGLTGLTPCRAQRAQAVVHFG